jgi:hypothetical protein
VWAMAEAHNGQQPTALASEPEPQPDIAAGAERLVAQDERARLAFAQQLDRARAKSSSVTAGATVHPTAAIGAVAAGHPLRLEWLPAAVPSAPLEIANSPPACIVAVHGEPAIIVLYRDYAVQSAARTYHRAPPDFGRRLDGTACPQPPPI